MAMSTCGIIAKTILSPHPTKAFQHLDVLRREGRFIDINLIAGDQKFPAHKVVLCACSSYFDGMFRPGFQEAGVNEVKLSDFHPQTLESLIEFMYTATITITEDNAQNVLAGANLLLLHEVREAASEVLSKMLDSKNVLALRSIGSAFSCKDLEKRAQNFILERFEIVALEEEFCEIDVDYLKSLLSHDDIIVRSEETIWNCLIRWVSSDSSNRKSHFQELLPDVLRISLLNPNFVRSEILPHPWISSSSSLSSYVQASLEQLDSLSVGSIPTPPYRGSSQLLFLQCCNSSPWLNISPVLYDFKKNSWYGLPGPISPLKYREGTVYVFWEGSVLSIGGEYNLEPESMMGIVDRRPPIVGVHHELRLDNETYALKLGSKIWTVHSTLSLARKRHQAVVANGKIYVLGGCDHNATPVNSVEIFSDGQWTIGPPMAQRRVSHGAVEIDGNVWVVGGWDGQKTVHIVEKLDKLSGKWEEIQTHWSPSEMGDPVRMKMGVTVLDGKLYTVGGCVQTLDPCFSAHCLDPVSKKWKKLPNMNFSRNNPVLIPYRGSLYVFGGDGNSQGLVEKYDPHIDSWEIVDSKIKNFVTAAYSGTLVDKPWDWDLPGRADDRELIESGSTRHMQRILSGIGLDVVQTMRSHNLY